MHVCRVFRVPVYQWHTDNVYREHKPLSLCEPNMWRSFVAVGNFSCSISLSLFSIRWHSTANTNHDSSSGDDDGGGGSSSSRHRHRRCTQSATIKRNGHNFLINSSTFIMLLSFSVFSIFLPFANSWPICTNIAARQRESAQHTHTHSFCNVVFFSFKSNHPMSSAVPAIYYAKHSTAQHHTVRFNSFVYPAPFIKPLLFRFLLKFVALKCLCRLHLHENLLSFTI